MIFDDFKMRVCCSTKTVFEIPINLLQVQEIFKWILTYYHKYKHAQPYGPITFYILF